MAKSLDDFCWFMIKISKEWKGWIVHLKMSRDVFVAIVTQDLGLCC